MVKIMNRIISNSLVIFFICCCFSSVVLSAELLEKYGCFAGLEDSIKVRGVNIDFDVPPVIKEGRTLIPVRAVMNGLGAEVKWDEVARTVTITRDGKIIILNIVNGAAFVNGKKLELDVPAQIINNRTFIPLRFIAESLGEKVEFVEETGEINIG